MNRYSPLTLISLLMISLTFCVVHAQDTDIGTNSNDSFDKMFAQAREESRKQILSNFPDNQTNAQQTAPNSLHPENKMGQPNNSLNQPNTGSANQSAPAGPTAPAPNIPLPNAAPTNTGSPPMNIYLPPTSAPPPSASPQAPVPLPSAG
jgi:hypothetical protein